MIARPYPAGSATRISVLRVFNNEQVPLDAGLGGFADCGQRKDPITERFERIAVPLVRPPHGVLGQHTLLSRIDAEALDGYVRQRHEEGAAESTIYKECNTLAGGLKLARRHRKYPYALDEVMPTVCGASPPGKTHLVRAEVDKLLAVLTPKRAAVVAFIVATGADWRSVADAKAEDFDLKRRSILVRGTKNEKRWRTIPILEPFKDLAEIAVAAVPFEPWGSVRRDLAVACRKAKVTKITPRDLRRSHGSILRQMGIEPHLISKMLGHADSRMVERIYGQLPPEALGKLMAARLPKPRKPRGTKEVQRPPEPPKNSQSSLNGLWN